MTKSSSVGFFELFFNIFNPWLAESTHIEGQLWSLFLNLGRDLSPQTTNSADLWWLYLYYTFVFYFTLTCALSPIVLLYLYLFYSFFEINLLLIFWLLEVKLRLSSVQFSRSVVSDSLQPHESQHTRPPCPSPTPRVHSDSSIESVMPSSHLILGHPLLLLPSIPPSIRVFSNESTLRMRCPKYWISALASFLPKKSQGWSPSEWTGWISLQSKGLSIVFSNTTVQKHQFFGAHLFSQSNTHIHTWPLEKP